ncbi:hypothetical protein C5167_014309 [Papaver somniferum]|uniref:Uncharacterized protein n=1 Tax=Papaver somniferum TaxID=3469 RepID=A0A4Y7J6U5_PAPSO|nr:hypothetical protein C5167_014309 [Papaver somniferum]
MASLEWAVMEKIKDVMANMRDSSMEEVAETRVEKVILLRNKHYGDILEIHMASNNLQIEAGDDASINVRSIDNISFLKLGFENHNTISVLLESQSY